MRRFATALAATALGTSALLVPVAAEAGTSLGNGCVLTDATGGLTAVMRAGAVSNPLPVAAPSGGVVTSARFQVPAGPFSLPTVLKVLRPGAAPNQYTVVGQGASVVVTGGTTTFPFRIPIAIGDVIGLYGSVGTPGCNTGVAGDVIGVASGDQAPGTTATYSTSNGWALPVVLTVEPDADRDGFGDETQDACPRLASTQLQCPVTVGSFAAATGKRVTVVVTTDAPAAVAVTGAAKVRGKQIALSGGTQNVAPGALTTFLVRLPKALRSALAGLPSRRSIKVVVTATATDSLGRPTTSTSKVTLRGTAP